MNKKLPSVYANPIPKKFSNVQEMYYGSLKDNENREVVDVDKVIDSIFSSRNFVYKSEVEIETNEGIVFTTIVGKTRNSLLTMDGKVIPISSIRRITKK